MSDKEEETYSHVFSSLKHPVRRKILRILATGPRSFSGILEQVDVESSHLSYHLENLEGLIMKRDNEYSLSNVGRAAVSLMSRVEEPASTSFLMKRSLLHFFRVTQKAWLVGIIIVVLIVSLSANLYLSSSNTQLSAALDNEKWQDVQNVAFSLEALSGGYRMPAPSVRHEYSNVSIVNMAADHIVVNVHYGSQSLQQLMNLDPTHQKNLQVIDDLFESFSRFANLLNMLLGENETSAAVALIEQLSNNVSDYPRQVGSELRSAYGSFGRVFEHALELVAEDADMTRNIVDQVMMQAAG